MAAYLPSTLAVSTVTRTSLPEYLTALSIRFDTAARTSSGSPSKVVGPGVVFERFRAQVMEGARARQALFHGGVQVDRRTEGLAAGRADSPGAQHLLDGGEQPLAVVHHDAVEFLAPGFIHFPRLQRFQVQPDGRHRSFQLVGYRVDERVVLGVAADLPHQEGRVEDHAANDGGQQQHSQEQQDARAPVQQHPADVEKQDDRDQADAERDEERDRLLPAGDYHASSLSRTRWRWTAGLRRFLFHQHAVGPGRLNGPGHAQETQDLDGDPGEVELVP